MAKVKVFIAVPIGDTCGLSPTWSLKLTELLKYVPGEYEVQVMKGYPIDVVRNAAVKMAKERGATHIFFLDSDVVPDRNDTILQLYRWRLPVVCGIYRLKRIDSSQVFPFSVYKWNPERNAFRYLVPSDIPPGSRLIPIEGGGLGLCLIDMRVFNVIDEPYFKWELYPWNPPPGGLSEDLYFFKKVIDHGIQPYADLQVTASHYLAPPVALKIDGTLYNTP
jgi:hypothetical protein